MPTDRIITINLQAFGTYDDAGIYQPGADMLRRTWATLLDTTLFRYIIPAGARAEEDAIYRVRYFRELASADVRIVFVTEDDGDFYRVNRIEEVTGRDGKTRRRWLDISCIRPDPQPIGS